MRHEATSTPVLCFALCGRDYALSIDDVVEVAAMVEAAPLGANTNPAQYGVVIRRGTPVILIDLRRVFGCEDAPVDLSTLFIVVQHRNEMVGFIVDRVEGVIYFSQGDVRPMNGEQDYVRGVIAQDNRLIQWLRTAPILDDTLPNDDGG